MARSVVDMTLLGAVLLATTVLAELLGAVNMGTALTFGTIAFTVALLWLLLRPGA